AAYSDRMWRTTATAASRSPDACSCTTSRGAFPGATVYQTVPAARPQPLGSFESVVAPSVEPVTFVASVPYGAAWPRVSFAGGKNSFAVSSNAPSVVDRLWPTRTRADGRRVAAIATPAAGPAAGV